MPTVCTLGLARSLDRYAKLKNKRIDIHVKVDTGMGRLGVPAHRALEWMRELEAAPVRIEGTFMGFAEDDDFDGEQLARFQRLAFSVSPPEQPKTQTQMLWPC